jgi:uncharacterized protein HemY
MTALEEGRSALKQGEWEAARAAFERAVAEGESPERRDGSGYYLENGFRLVLAQSRSRGSRGARAA